METRNLNSSSPAVLSTPQQTEKPKQVQAEVELPKAAALANARIEDVFVKTDSKQDMEEPASVRKEFEQLKNKLLASGGNPVSYRVGLNTGKGNQSGVALAGNLLDDSSPKRLVVDHNSFNGCNSVISAQYKEQDGNITKTVEKKHFGERENYSLTVGEDNTILDKEVKRSEVLPGSIGYY
jgi:hypothetical protein